MRVVWGVLDVADAGSSDTYGVSNVIVHEGYPNDSPPTDEASGAGRYDDIGLLLLDRAVGGATRPSCRPWPTPSPRWTAARP